MEARLVERAQRGDEVAFVELLDRYGGRCNGVAYGILRDAERAGDAVQQAFLLAWRDLPRLRDPDRFGVWLHRLLVHACFEEARRHRRWTTHVQVLPLNRLTTPDPAGQIADRELLERAFERLTPEHRAVVVLHLHAGLPVGMIADIVGVPEGTVKSRLHHATRQLRAAITADRAIDDLLEEPRELPA
jgi:RNA polymerase sigma-70 factor, ECF subfamily